MRVRLLHRDRAGDGTPLAAGAETLVQDLELEIVLRAMADGDDFLLEVARRGVLASLEDPEAIHYRQEVFADCLRHPDLVRDLYSLASEAVRGEREILRGFGDYPDAVLRRAVERLELFGRSLRRLRAIADARGASVHSEGLRTFFERIGGELDDEWFVSFDRHLEDLRFRHGVTFSAALGPGNQGTAHLLHRTVPRGIGWWTRLRLSDEDGFTIEVDGRSETATRQLAELRERGVALVADVGAQSADHVSDFLQELRAEIGFYLGGVNLREQLASRGVPVSRPAPHPSSASGLAFSGLRDVALTLLGPAPVVPNDLVAEDRPLLLVTGANQGGKSTFLRSVGQAQLLLQCGLHVAAESFQSAPCAGLFTHFRREEDARLASGKLDEELRRMSGIVDRLRPGAMLLCNESFAATNEGEGSEIAYQVVRALRDSGVRVLFVTHLYELTSRLRQEAPDTMFLRAERQADGTRTFRIVEGEPLSTSFGRDLYRRLFPESEGEATDDP